MKGNTLIRLRSILLIFTMAMALQIQAQVTIQGRIKPGQHWENKIYLSVLQDFSRSFQTVDTIKPGPDGSFSYQWPASDTNIIYRLLLPPKNGNQHSIVEGYADNYLYLVGRDGSNYEIIGDADSLFYSSTISGDSIAGVINRLKEYKRPFYQLAVSTTAEKARFVDSLTVINKRMMENWRMAAEKYRSQLKDFLVKEEDEGLMLLGLYYYFLADFGRYDSVLFKQVIDRFREKGSNYHVYKTLESRMKQADIKRIGRKIPIAGLRDTSGRMVNSDDLQARLMVIDYWASWCNPCRKANTGYLKELNESLQLIDASLIGISVDADMDKWKMAIEKDKTSWPQYIDTTPGGLADQLQVYSFPTYLVVDEDQRILYETNNEMELRSFIENFRQ